MKKKLSLVRIDFDDHSHAIGGHAEIIRCTVWGVLFKETKTAYYVSCWMADGELNAENSDTYCIRKHHGVKVTRIRTERLT